MEDKPEKAKKVKTVEVRLIDVSNTTALVEYGSLEDPKRCLIPVDTLDGDKVAADVLELGIEYGIPWEQLLTFSLKPADFAKELHRNGIWTAQDVLKHSGAVHGALQAVYGIELAKIYQIASERK